MMHRLVCLLLLSACWSPVLARVGPLPPEPPKDTPRLTKLRTLAFDRRPSAILKARAPQFPSTKDDKKPEPLDLELQAFQRQVTLGEWPAVKAYLAKLPEAEGKAMCVSVELGLGTKREDGDLVAAFGIFEDRSHALESLWFLSTPWTARQVYEATFAGVGDPSTAPSSPSSGSNSPNSDS